ALEVRERHEPDEPAVAEDDAVAVRGLAELGECGGEYVVFAQHSEYGRREHALADRSPWPVVSGDGSDEAERQYADELAVSNDGVERMPRAACRLVHEGCDRSVRVGGDRAASHQI